MVLIAVTDHPSRHRAHESWRTPEVVQTPDAGHHKIMPVVIRRATPVQSDVIPVRRYLGRAPLRVDEIQALAERIVSLAEKLRLKRFSPKICSPVVRRIENRFGHAD